MEITFPKKKQNLKVKVTGDEIIIYDMDLKKVHVVNEIAEKVLSFCDGTNSVEQISEHIKSEYETEDGKDICNDITGIIEKFNEIELLESV
jgi:hypothetical protein